MARSCGFWRIKIAVPATATTIPRTTAAAIHNQVFGLPTPTPGITGRWTSKSCRAVEPGRSTSLGTSGAAADCTGSSERVATTGGAPETCASSVFAERTAFVRSSGAVVDERSSLALFAPTIGAAGAPFDPTSDCGGFPGDTPGARRAGTGEAAVASAPAEGLPTGGVDGWDAAPEANWPCVGAIGGGRGAAD